MANLSKIKRDSLIDKIENLKMKNKKDEDTTLLLNEIINELTGKKYGLVWELHEENVDKKMETAIPVFDEIKEREICGNPDDKKINETILKINLSDVNFDENSSEVSFKKNGMGLDFGGIAKGYTSSQLMDIFKEYEIKSAMVSLGGNVQVLGAKPDGSLWKVAVKNPNKNDDYLGIITAKDKAVITSGGYERYFDKDGKRYHHILDPDTGYPADSDLQSVTIVSSDGALADAYSTALFVMGLEKSIDFWYENSEDFDAVLYTSDGKLYVTEGISDNFTSENKFKVINKKV